VAPLDVDEALSGLRQLLGRLAGPHVELVVECEAGLPPILFDASAFRQVLVELVRSASAAMRDPGRISVRAGAQAGRVVLTVADTGPGIALDALPGMLEPFHAASRHSSRAEAGLAAVHDVVVENGADIRIASTPGGGAKVSIYLPV
jgi:signal transduction histidine kinase